MDPYTRKTMRAAVAGRYGDPVRIELVERPEPGPGEVLIRVLASAVNAGDARLRSGRFPRGFGLPARVALGLRGPRRAILGNAVSGVVEQVGPNVDLSGDEVTGMNGTRMGGHAEYMVMAADRVVRKPAGITHEDAAAVLFGGTTARHFLRDWVRPGDRVLVVGASGSVGSSAVQLAAIDGAEVTGVCSAANADLVRRLGAAHIIDYRTTPITGQYDVVVDTVGTLRPRDRQRLAPQGVLILVAADLLDTARARGPVLAGPAGERVADVELLLTLLAAGRLDPVMRHLGGLNALPGAYAEIDAGHKVGNLVVTPG